MPGLLRKVEVEILAHPDHLGLYRLNLAVAKLADVSVERREQGLGHGSELAAFLETREVLFKAISDQHAGRAPELANVERAGLVETADLVELEPLVRAYVESYLQLASLPPEQWRIGRALSARRG